MKAEGIFKNVSTELLFTYKIIKMNTLKRLRKNYINYLKQNPKSHKWLKESCELLVISKSDFT